MDTITQGLLGAVTAQLGFRQRIGRDATWVAAFAATLPDWDMFVSPFLSLTGAEVDQFTRVVIHRGLSHSLFMTPILSLPVALAWWWFRRRAANNGNDSHRKPFWLLYACVFVAVLSAPLLDWCTSYGTQLLAPFTKARYTIDAIAIVDIIYTPLLILTLLTCYLTRKFARGPAVKATLAIGWIGFALSIGYLAAGRVAHDLAVTKAIAAYEKPETIIRADAFPALGTIFLWRAVLETEDGWVAMRVHHFSDAPNETLQHKHATKTDNQWVRSARELRQVKIYNWFAGNKMRADYTQSNGNHIITFHDMRYAHPLDSTESFWPVTVIYDSHGNLQHVGRSFRHREGSFPKAVAEAWRDIFTP